MIAQVQTAFQGADCSLDLALAQEHVADGKPAQHLAQWMLGALRYFERPFCVAHTSTEIATFDNGKHQPYAVDDGGN